MKTINYFLQFSFIRFFFFLINILPLDISINLSTLIFRTAGKLSSADKTAIKNCKFVFPNLEDIKIRKIVDESWNNLGITVCELIKFNKLLRKNKVVLSGLKNIENIKKNKQQAIFISIHQSNWEFLVPMLDRQDIRIGAIYRHINNFFLDKLILKIRKKTLKSHKNFYTPKGKKSAKEILEGVINKKNIFLLVDQKDSAGTLINFFGKDVKTQTGFLKIARKYNLKIIPMKNIRLPDNTLEITFEHPLDHNEDSISDNAKMLEINSIVERWIRENPENWFWQHKRFN